MILNAMLVCTFAKGTKWTVAANVGGYFPAELLTNAKGDETRVYCVPPFAKCNRQRRGAYTITANKSITTVYVPDLNYPNVGYGDIEGTNDALIIDRDDEKGSLTIYVAKGQKQNVEAVYGRYLDGDLQEDVNNLIAMVE